MLEFQKDAPLRQEDYQALAEENRQLGEKVARLAEEAKPGHQERRRHIFKMTALIAACVIFVSGMITLLSITLPPPLPDPSANPSSLGRQTECYFVAPRGTENKNEPWRTDWALWRSPCEHCDNDVVSSAPSSKSWFGSKDEAWQFLLKWKLVPCQ